MTDPNQPEPVGGLLVLDKPLGFSSARAVANIKGRLRTGGQPKSIKVGHAGTLDPLATGVLLVLVGKATRLQDSFMAGEKGYRADIDLCAFTSTDDAEGERTEIEVASPPTRAAIERTLAANFLGEVMQTPPAFSAIKVGGKRSYAEARAGRDVKLAARPVQIHETQLVDYSFPKLVLDIRCAKGTYIRSIARDLGLALGTGGSLTALRRTRVGPYTLKEARTLEQLPEPLQPQHLQTTPAIEALLAKARGELPQD